MEHQFDIVAFPAEGGPEKSVVILGRSPLAPPIARASRRVPHSDLFGWSHVKGASGQHA